MKRNISDLLDTYFDESVDLDNSTPLSSSRIKELTMNKITREKSHPKHRAPIRLLIAAATVAALSVSALAASYVLGAGTLFQDYFGTKGDGLTAGQIQVMDHIGKTFEGGVTSNGTTMTPIAALADENVYYLRLRIEAPEGVVLPDLDPDVEGYYQLSGDQWPEERMTVEPVEGAYHDFSYGTSLKWLPDDDPTDNIKEVVVLLTLTRSVYNETLDEAKFNDGVSKLLTIHGLWIQSPYKEYTQILSGEFTFDIGLYYRSQTVTFDCEGAAYEDPTYGFTNYLDRMTLSPLSMSFRFRSNLLDNPVITTGAPGHIEIVMKDGTKIFEEANKEIQQRNESEGMDPRFDPAAMIGDTADLSTSWDILFDTPLDLTQVDYIQYGDYQFPVEIQ